MLGEEDWLMSFLVRNFRTTDLKAIECPQNFNENIDSPSSPLLCRFNGGRRSQRFSSMKRNQGCSYPSDASERRND